MSKELLPWEDPNQYPSDGNDEPSERDEDRCRTCGAELEEPQPQGKFSECLSCISTESLTLRDLFGDIDEDEDFLSGVTCNPDAPEECESCQ